MGLALACVMLVSSNVQAIESPVLSYSFDAIQGDTVTDISGSGNDGTMEDAPAVVGGVFGEALEFGDSRVRIAVGVLEANTWAHAAVVGDTQNFRIYINGELSTESAFQATRGNNQEFMAGGYAGGESYSGAIDDLAIFSVALEQADIAGIMENGLGNLTSVDASGKMATTWADLKKSF